MRPPRANAAARARTELIWHIAFANPTSDGQPTYFVITDGAAEIPVSYVGRDPRPDLFTEGQGTIAKGYYRDGRFEARDLLAKHDETYMPKEVMDTLKESGVYQDPNS